MVSTDLRDASCVNIPPRILIADIQRTVAHHFQVSMALLTSGKRRGDIVHARQVAMYLAKRLTSQSLPEIGRRFGGRDHTTVLHGVNKVAEKLHGDDALRDEVTDLAEQIVLESIS